MFVLYSYRKRAGIGVATGITGLVSNGYWQAYRKKGRVGAAHSIAHGAGTSIAIAAQNRVAIGTIIQCRHRPGDIFPAGRCVTVGNFDDNWTRRTSDRRFGFVVYSHHKSTSDAAVVLRILGGSAYHRRGTGSKEIVRLFVASYDQTAIWCAIIVKTNAH